MSEQVIRNGNVMERSRTRTIAQVAMLGAVAGVLMNFEVPLPFLAPSFYQLDFSEIPALIGSFAMGPVAGMLIELVKILVHLVTKGTMTAGVGDVANFIFGCSYVIPAGLIYRYQHKKTRTHAVAGMAVGVILTTILYKCICSSSGIRKGIWNAGSGIYRDGRSSTQRCYQPSYLCNYDSCAI